jgi:hypothetical protein
VGILLLIPETMCLFISVCRKFTPRSLEYNLRIPVLFYDKIMYTLACDFLHNNFLLSRPKLLNIDILWSIFGGHPSYVNTNSPCSTIAT